MHPEEAVNPGYAYNRMKTILKNTGLPSIRFHDLRHTFATASLEHGMDINTLSTIIGHVSSSTTLNIYAHVTDKMQKTAAAKIDQGIGKVTPSSEQEIIPLKLPPLPSSPTRTSATSPARWGLSARSIIASGRGTTPYR